MDIKARIEEVIIQRGLTKSKVAERMGKYNQAFNQLITNPKWETVEHVADAIGITTEELLFAPLEKLSSGNNPSDGDNSNLPRLPEQSRTIGMLVCPNCGKGFKLGIENV